MPATTPSIRDTDEDPQAAQERPMPDEDGPHDVPDEAVIDKTLPAGSGRGSDRPRDERP
jgi:hypothetical protein